MQQKCDIAVYGLGVMGASLAKNMLNHGYRVVVYSISEQERARFKDDIKNQDTYVIAESEEELLQSLASPRKIFIMIMAGKPVDMVLDSLIPCLDKNDVVMDGGNSYYEESVRRYYKCQEAGIQFLGVGVSGGEKGALTGPSMMVGGSRRGWESSRRILQTIAAKYEGNPCCVYLGNEGAGHYVKMVHNGIEYGILQLLSETYHYLKDGIHAPHEKITELFRSWKESELSSYLIDISIQVLEKRDEDGKFLLDKIRDKADQKGTGLWTLKEALKAGIYVPTIYEAVQARSFSGRDKVRNSGRKILAKGQSTALFIELDESICHMFKEALYWGMISCYSQGLELIQYASKKYDWQIPILEVVQVWREGCIIRSALLSEIQNALIGKPEALILSQYWTDREEKVESVRYITANALLAGYPCAAYESVLNYYSYFETETMPVCFLQGLRDCFGAHTYERKDGNGRFHTEWTE